MAALMPLMTSEEVAERDAHLRALFSSLVEGEDYDPGGKGGLFGSDRPSLLQPGAEKLAAIFGLGLRSEVTHRTEDFTGSRTGEPLVTYEVTTTALGPVGELICTGLGVCTSAEPAFRWRWVGIHDVPPGLSTEGLLVQRGTRTEFEFAIEKAETTGPYGKPAEYWQDFRYALETGTAVLTPKETRTGRQLPAWTIEVTQVRIPNPDMAINANAILKRAKKRALVAAVITAIGGLSAIFTQDMEAEEAGRVRPASGGATPPPRPPVMAEAEEDAQWEADPPAARGAAAWHATPTIEAMLVPADLGGADGVMAIIQAELGDHLWHRNSAWTAALVRAAGLVSTPSQLADVAGPFSKVVDRLSPAERGKVEAALTEAAARATEPGEV